MRIAQVNCSYRPNLDSGKYLASVPTLIYTCEALTQAGCDVSVLQRFWKDEDARMNGVRYCFRKDATKGAYARPWTMPMKLLHLTRTLKPDVLHVNGLIFPVQVAMLRTAVGNRGRIVVQHHGELPARGRLLPLQRLCLRLADAFIFNGVANADIWRTAGIVRGHQPVFEAIESSCNFTPMTQGQAQREHGWGADRVVGGSIASTQGSTDGSRGILACCPDTGRCSIVHDLRRRDVVGAGA